MEQRVSIPSNGKSRGRPVQGGFDARQSLIYAAKVRFSQHPYPKVTTRQLAVDAGVNVGLIKYYFINKEGLYRAIFRDVVDKIAFKIKQLIDTNQFDGFESFFRFHAHLMLENP